MKQNKYYSFLLLILVVILGACKGQSKDSNFDTTLLPLSVDEEIGYANSEGKFLINPQFKEAFFFANNGLAKVRKEDKYGFINKEGKLVIPYQYHQATSFYEGLACVVTDASAPFYINEKGEKVIEVKRAEKASYFTEGFAPFSIKKKDSKDEIWGFINKKGEEIITANYKNVKHFSQGLAAFREKDKWGFLDGAGKIIVNPQFAEAYPFQEDLATVKNEKGKWGAIDKSGVLKIDYQFDDMTNFSEGMAAVLSGKKWGYVNKDGKLVVNPQFEQGMTFKNGVATIKKDGKTGVIDKSGILLANPQFSDAYIIGNSILVDAEGKIGITDLKGKYTANPQFSKLNSSIIDVLAIDDARFQDLVSNLYINTQAEDEEEKNRILKAIVGKTFVFNDGCSTSADRYMAIRALRSPRTFTEKGVIDTLNIHGYAEGQTLIISTGTYTINTKNKTIKVVYTNRVTKLIPNGHPSNGIISNEETTSKEIVNIEYKVSSCKGIFMLRNDNDKGGADKGAYDAYVKEADLTKISQATEEQITPDYSSNDNTSDYNSKKVVVVEEEKKYGEDENPQREVPSGYAQAITKSGCTIRERATVRSEQTDFVPRWEMMQVLAKTNVYQKIEDKSGYWYKISYNGKVGYCFGGFMKVNF